MPITFPPNVRDAWGEDVADEVARVLDETFEQRAVARDEFRKVLSRLDVLEERFDHVDERFEQMDDRFDRIEDRLNQMDARFDTMNARMDERFDAINERFDERSDRIDENLGQMNARIDQVHEAMRVQTRWTVGTIALFGTIVTVLLAVAQFTAG